MVRSRVKWRPRTKRDFEKIGNKEIEEKIRSEVGKHLASNPT